MQKLHCIISLINFEGIFAKKEQSNVVLVFVLQSNGPNYLRLNFAKMITLALILEHSEQNGSKDISYLIKSIKKKSTVKEEKKNKKNDKAN